MCNQTNEIAFVEKDSNGDLVKIKYVVPSVTGYLNTVTDGVVIPEELDSNGELTIKLKIKKDPLVPRIAGEKTLVHEFELSAADLTSIGVTSTTKINLEYSTTTPEGEAKPIMICKTVCWMEGPYGPRTCKEICMFASEWDEDVAM